MRHSYRKFVGVGLILVGGAGLVKLALPIILAKSTIFIRQFTFIEVPSRVTASPPTSTENQRLPSYFYLSIPKLHINQAVVKTNSYDASPDKNLGHYAGTALPGDVGNTFIYGHSTYKFLFSADNYKTIFSRLDELVIGDELTLTYLGKTYLYKVDAVAQVKPSEIKFNESIFPYAQPQKTLTLMTCYPFGSQTNRLVVGAILISGN